MFLANWWTELPSLLLRNETEGGNWLDVQVEARLGLGRLPAEVETAVYRIVQEALTNVARHAKASEPITLLITPD